nr:MAG: hypothetical protein [Microvirus sp.]
MWKNQYQKQLDMCKQKHELTGEDSLVVKTAVRGNAEKLAQMLLAGQYVEGQRLGYEFGPEDAIPDTITVRPGKSADIVQVLDFAADLGARIRASIRSKEAKIEAEPTGVREEDGKGKESPSEASRAGISADSDPRTDGGTKG